MRFLEMVAGARRHIRRRLQGLRHRGPPARAQAWPGRLLHGLSVPLVVYALIRNGDATGSLFKPAELREELWVGGLLGLLLSARLAWNRWGDGGSRLPGDGPAWERRLARWAHRAIYGLLAYLIASGFAIAWLRPGARIDPAALFFASDSLALNIALDSHAAAGNLLMGLLALHIAAAFWHLLLRRDGVWQSMLGGPFSGRRRPRPPAQT